MKKLSLSILFVLSMALVVACGGGGGGSSDNPLEGMEGQGWNEFPSFNAGTPIGSDESDPTFHEYAFSGVIESDITTARADLVSAGFSVGSCPVDTSTKVECTYVKSVGDTDYVVYIEWGVVNANELILATEIIVNKEPPVGNAPTGITVSPTTAQVGVATTFTFTYDPVDYAGTCGFFSSDFNISGSVNSTSARLSAKAAGTATITLTCAGTAFPMQITVTN